MSSTTDRMPRSILVASTSASSATRPSPQVPQDNDSSRLGRSYLRAEPLTSAHRETISGPEVLPLDPRGTEATFGDGILPHSAAPIEAPEPIDMVRGEFTPSSLRFCPLPTTGRPRRRQSLSVGIAARSHLLACQGSVPVKPKPAPAAAPESWGLDPALLQAASKQNIKRNRSNPPPPPPKREDAIDVGVVVQKGVKRIMRRLRGDKPPPSTAPPPAKSEQPTAPPEPPTPTDLPTETEAQHHRPHHERSNSINIGELRLHPDHIPVHSDTSSLGELEDDEDPTEELEHEELMHSEHEEESGIRQKPDLDSPGSHHVWNSPYQHPQIPRGEHDYHPPEWEEDIPSIAAL